MKVDTVITLDNDMNVLLIDKTVYNNANYFLGILLNANEEPTDKNIILKEIIEAGETYVEKEEDPKILDVLLQKFTQSLKDFVDKLPEKI